MQRRLELYASTRYAKKRKYRPKKIEIVTGTDGVDRMPPKYRCGERLYGGMAGNEAQGVEEYNRGGSGDQIMIGAQREIKLKIHHSEESPRVFKVVEDNGRSLGTIR
ncbi:hypothetical protein SERLA73DRAFT_173764 [Serpula lacrymans var. lacrymans S7.3]|uniref:Uncharacterized protein n=1 Tax=Serpula lacrymans var. lacrymans (strain S7.3) TaxID=936435 RepID=F8PGV8_SERL3|nr:hypothetical protein SERLA73DRAFT_173764 [Serpula lacrymans var. lacrymans S7.3]